MPRTNDSRERMVRGAAALLSERGASATGFRDVVARTGVSRGSITHHFPGGKSEMVADAVRWTARRVAAALTERGDPTTMLAAMVGSYREALLASRFEAGCPVGAVAAGQHDDELVRRASAEAFATWHSLIATSFAERGRTPDRAASLADLVISAVEGALLLCRAQRTTAPLDRVERELGRLLRSPD